MMGKKTLTIASALKAEMIERNSEVAWAGDPDLCISAYLRTGGKVQHPLNKIRAVIQAARASELFKQDGYIRAMDSAGRREILHPCFIISHETHSPTSENKK